MICEYCKQDKDSRIITFAGKKTAICSECYAKEIDEVLRKNKCRFCGGERFGCMCYGGKNTNI